jgi:hypothetical protein
VPIALAAVALIGSALALGGGPTLSKKTPDAPPANDVAGAQNLTGETAGRPADNGTMPSAQLSGATPPAPLVDAQAAEGLASQASAQTTDPGSARRVLVQPDEVLIASQGSSAAERRSAPSASKPPAEPASEQMHDAIGATLASLDMPRRNVLGNLPPGSRSARRRRLSLARR